MNARRLWLGGILAVACLALAPSLPSGGAAAKRRVPQGRRGAIDCKSLPAPNDPPIGVGIDTLATDGAITIDGQSYGESSRSRFDLAYVVLDRTTRCPVEFGSVSGLQEGLTKLIDTADRYRAGANYLKYLMIVSGRYSNVPHASLFTLFKKLGAPVVSVSQYNRFRSDMPPFSIIGLPGAPAGAATVRIGSSLDRPKSGAITGYLQKNLAVSLGGAVYDYVSPEYPAFDTSAPGSTTTSNVMTVGDQTYSAGLTDIPRATAGLHVLILDSLTLQPLINHALVTNSTNSQYTDRQLQGGAAGFLKQWLDSPSGKAGSNQPDVTVFVQTIGKPKAAGPEWQGVVDQLGRLGANRLYVNALDGTNGYALVGRLYSDLPPAEASTASNQGATYPPARLTGVLARTRTSTFEPIIDTTPTAKNTTGAVNTSLMKVAYQPPAPWPELAPGEQNPKRVAAAQEFICKRLGFCHTDADGKPSPTSCASVRSCYWEKDQENWTTKHTVLLALQYAPGGGFDQRTFESVKHELLDEIKDVANVQNYVEGLQKPFTASAGESQVKLQEIGEELFNALNPPETSLSTSSTLELISKVVAIGKLVPPPGGNIAGGLSAAFGLAAYLSDRDGQPILGGEVKATTRQLAHQLFERFNLARAELREVDRLLVSDYGKLTAASDHIDDDWSITGSDPVQTQLQLTSAAKQWFYDALVPVAYPYLIRANSANARSLNCVSSPRDGWPNQPDQDQMLATVGYDGNGQPIKAIFFFTRGIFGGSSPTGKLGDDLFAPTSAPAPAPTGQAIEKLSFFTPSVFNDRIIHAVNGTYNCSVGWLPHFQ